MKEEGTVFFAWLFCFRQDHISLLLPSLLLGLGPRQQVKQKMRNSCFLRCLFTYQFNYTSYHSMIIDFLRLLVCLKLDREQKTLLFLVFGIVFLYQRRKVIIILSKLQVLAQAWSVFLLNVNDFKRPTILKKITRGIIFQSEQICLGIFKNAPWINVMSLTTSRCCILMTDTDHC